MNKKLFYLLICVAMISFVPYVYAQVTVVEGFENPANPGGWQEVSPGGQTQNATNSTVPNYVGTNVTEGAQAGQFTHPWIVPGSAALSNPYYATGPLTFWSMRINISIPSAFSSIPHTSVLKADVYNNTNDPMGFSLCLRDSGGTGGLERGPFKTLPPNAASIYSWDLQTEPATSFVTGNSTLDGSSSVLRGMFLYTETAPTVGNWDMTVDNIRVETPQTDFDEPAATVIYSATQGTNPGDLLITWKANTEPDLDHYNVYLAKDENFGVPIGNRLGFPGSPTVTVPAGTNSVTISGVSTEVNLYVKVTASDNASPSPNESYSHVALGARLHADGSPLKDLVVLDLDRYFNDPSDPNFAVYGYSHMICYDGQALLANNRYYASCFIHAVSEGAVTPVAATDTIVIWPCGLDGNAGVGESLSPNAVTVLTNYIADGGKILISGVGIGENLETNGSPEDQAFFANVLQADLINPFVNTYLVTGGVPFFGIGNFDLGPDVFNLAAFYSLSSEVYQPLGTAQGAMSYTGITTGYPAIYFGNQVVLFGFGFEGVRDEGQNFAAAQEARRALLRNVLQYLLPTASSEVPHFDLYK